LATEVSIARYESDERARDLADLEHLRRESDFVENERSQLDHERRMHEYRDEQALIDQERRELELQEERLNTLELEKLREDQRYLDEAKLYEFEEGVERGYEDRLRNLEASDYYPTILPY
jgi:hypothetical protein